MSLRARRSRERRAVALGCALATLGAVLMAHADDDATAVTPGALVAQPVLGTNVDTPFGSSPGETPGEAWALGGSQLLRYTPADGWQPLPDAVGADGQPLADLRLSSWAAAARATARGGVALAATANDGGTPAQLLLTRDPGGALHAAPAPPDAPRPLLQPGEALYGTDAGGAQLAAVDEDGGRTGAFVVPSAGAGVQTGVLHYDGSSWSREDICLSAAPRPCTPPQRGFAVLALDAAARQDAWLLVRSTTTSGGIELLRRDTSGAAPSWRSYALAGSPFAQATVVVRGSTQSTTVKIVPRTAGQPLTATSAGLWVDATLTPVGSTSGFDATVFVDGAGHVTSWCDQPPALAGSAPALCNHPLGSALPRGAGRSFAWAGSGFGTRMITGLEAGAILSLEGDRFARVSTIGGHAGGSAAFASPAEGWLGGPLVHMTQQPDGDRVQPWPVPFRRPLTAIAPQPGAPVGALGSQALAVGDDGQVARYMPGQGWVPEPLLTPTGARATPRLRDIAWPEPGRAYAVGDHAEMWLWRSETGLWEPDPARPPNFALANLTGVAFDPADPNRGYAIGKQATLLRYGKQWEQDALPADLDPLANFSSIDFAGREALVTYKYLRNNAANNPIYQGGLLVNDGGGWHLDTSIQAALGNGVPERVAGLPDGGAVVAALDGRVAERDGAGQPWHAVASYGSDYPSALAAFREDGHVRAVVSTEGTDRTASAEYQTDLDQAFDQTPPGQAPLLTDPYPLPTAGYLLRQTASGWRDEQHQRFPEPDSAEVRTRDADYPMRPDAVLALALDPSGMQGWAVGGETGTFTRFSGDQLQTAGVMRYPADGTQPPSGTSTAAIAAGAGSATFAIGGNAQCAGVCADLGNTGIGPAAWLPSAVAAAGRVPGMRAFLYTGPGVADGVASLSPPLSASAYARESQAYATRLSANAGSVPVFAAVTPSDLDGGGSLATFAQAFGGFGAPLGGAAPGSGVAPVSGFDASSGAYSFDSTGAEGTVRVVVLGFTGAALGDAQRCWLAQQLSDAGAAGTPAIVVGNRDVSPAQRSPTAALDGAAVAATLVTGAPPPGCSLSSGPSGASAYFFDYPEQNRTYAITSGGRSIPSFGSGTLGYVTLPSAAETDFVGASGFLLTSVNVAQRDPSTNVAPVSVRLIPNIDDLALDADDGTLLRRSRPALFEALARRPRAGLRCFGVGACGFSPNPYIPIPTKCLGPRCASGILPTYSFTSSNPDIADFVRQDPASANARTVWLDANDKPVPDPTSGLLCAFNAGTTTVTVTTGGLSYAQQVTVQPGSVQRPCGTVPLKNPPTRQPQVHAPTQPPVEQPQPRLGGSTLLPPPPAPHHVAKPAPHPHPSVPAAAAFVAAAPGLAQVIPVVPPPAPTAARPIPPSGTASVQVYQSAVAPERQRDEEVAVDLVHHMVAARPTDDGLRVPAYLPALVLLAALGAATVRGSRRRRGLRHRLVYVESGADARRPRR